MPTRKTSTRLINVDVRCLQDANYALKGIGQHTLYLLRQLRALPATQLLPIADPLLGHIQQDVDSLFDGPPIWIEQLSEGIYFQPSPLTHDTAPLVTCLQAGMKACAVVHDFIPMRIPQLVSDPERSAAYRYLVQSLSRYDALFPNSDFTRAELERVLPDFPGRIAVAHCRSRFQAIAADGAVDAGSEGPIRPATLKQIAAQTPYIFVATADDPRKNPQAAIAAATELRALGFGLLIGGGLTEATRKGLLSVHPDQFVLAHPVFLPRLTDAELRQVYLEAELILVPSFDEGFSLPVAEALALQCTVVASAIPAHAEQIRDNNLLFDPTDVRSLVSAVKYALAARAGNTANRLTPNAAPDAAHFRFDYARETAAFLKNIRQLSSGKPRPGAPDERLLIVGPEFGRATGIAIYNNLMVEQLRKSGLDFSYVDLDAMDPEAFWAWLEEHQRARILYVMGNNNLYHSNCFTAMQHVPGYCILHDSRLFEFLLNRHGPHYIHALWQLRVRSTPISVEDVITWQRERRLLPESFLDPLVTRASKIFVHNVIAAKHIAEKYGYQNVHHLKFALQMTRAEVRQVGDLRAAKERNPQAPVELVVLGETEPTKGCTETIYALKILLMQGLNATLHFVGKSEEPYHSELLAAIETLRIQPSVVFHRYVSRQGYLDRLVSADIVIQLRYPIFGQISGPLADAVACGVPTVTTADLAVGMGLQESCIVIPNRFSPLHIAEGVREIIDHRRWNAVSLANSMSGYARELIRLCGVSTKTLRPARRA